MEGGRPPKGLAALCKRRQFRYSTVMFYRLLFSVAGLVAAVFGFFFFAGIADDSVGPNNILLWAVILGVIATILIAAARLRARGQTLPATVLLMLLAVPGMLALLVIVVIVIAQPRWN